MSHLRISPRNLGQMLLADFCPRCFFYQIQMNFQAPFSGHMPGLMFNLDVFEKRIVQTHIDDRGKLPSWLKQLDCTGVVDFPPKMTMDFPRYDITMVGKPDEVFCKSNGHLYLVDYKTAKYKGESDDFMGTYLGQLLGYVHLLEHNEVGEVDNAALVYFENLLTDYYLDPLSLLTNEGFEVPLGVKVHEIKIDRSALDPLLKQIRKFANMETPPKGRGKCKNCARLQKLLDGEVLRRGAEDYARNRDTLARFNSRKLEAERQEARSAGPEDEDGFPGLAADIQDFIPGSMDI